MDADEVEERIRSIGRLWKEQGDTPETRARTRDDLSGDLIPDEDRAAYGRAILACRVAIQADDRPAALALANEALAWDRSVKPTRIDDAAERLVSRLWATIWKGNPDDDRNG